MTGCSLFGPKIIKEEETNITKISTERMQELVSANNDVVDTIYGNPKFFTTAELRGHISEFYTDDVVKNYFSEKIFYDKEIKFVQLFLSITEKIFPKWNLQLTKII